MSRPHLADKEYVIDLECYAKTRIVFGEGAFSQLGEELMLTDCRSALIVTGGHHSRMESGAHDALMNMATGYDVETPIARPIPPEPNVHDVEKLIETMNFNQPQTVVAVGGGSVMDAAKAAYLAWQSGLNVTDLFGVGRVASKCPGREFKRVICIPTTSGTGSEVTPYANIVDPTRNVKCFLSDPQLVPDLALVDPTFTRSMGPELTVQTALDAMVHAIEAFLNTSTPSAPPESDRWAVTAVKLIRHALPIVLDEPRDPLAREMLSAASTLGGMCIACRPTSLPHLCSFSLYGKAPHGLAVAAMLPVFWRYYLRNGAVADQTMKLANLFESEKPQTTPEAVVDACAAFLASVSGIRALRDLPGMDADTIGRIAASAGKNAMKLESAPCPIPLDRAERILSETLLDSL